jgi:hypothetical protein
MSGKFFLAGLGHHNTRLWNVGPVFYANYTYFQSFSFTNTLSVYLLSIVLLVHLICYHLFASYDTFCWKDLAPHNELYRLQKSRSTTLSTDVIRLGFVPL